MLSSSFRTQILHAMDIALAEMACMLEMGKGHMMHYTLFTSTSGIFIRSCSGRFKHQLKQTQ